MTGTANPGYARGTLPKTLAAFLGMLALAAAPAGCSGGPDLSGDWRFAVGVDDEAGTGVVSLTQDDAGQLNGSGELCFEDDCDPVSAGGSLSEQGETVVLEMAEGSLRLQGDVSEDRLSGKAIASTAEEAGTFAAIRVSGDAPEAGSDEQSEQVRTALADYYEAFSFDGYDRQELTSSISGVVVEPVFWGSPVGQLAEDMGSTSDDARSEDYELEEFIPWDQRAGEVRGTARYTLDYDHGGESGTQRSVNDVSLVRWGDGWRVLWADAASMDLSAYDLTGRWEGELSEAPPGTATEFTMDLEQGEGLGEAPLGGTLTTDVGGEQRTGELFEYPLDAPTAPADVPSAVRGDGFVAVTATLEAAGIVDAGDYHLAGAFSTGSAPARSMEGEAQVRTCPDDGDASSCEAIETTFTARKVD